MRYCRAEASGALGCSVQAVPAALDEMVDATSAPVTWSVS